MSSSRHFVWVVALSTALAILSGAVALYRRGDFPVASVRVQRVIQRYTGPAVAVGVRVREVRDALGVPFTFIPQIGYVAHVGDSTGVSEIRLLVQPGKRAARPNDNDRVQAVELLTTSNDAFTTVAQDVSTYFRDPPSEGCLDQPEAGNFREVRYWTAPFPGGGIALTNDFGGNRSDPHPGVRVVGLLAFSGSFGGSETLRGNYSPQPCAERSGLIR